MRSLLMDTRYAFRTLLKAPGFTAIAVLSLALGIAVNSAVFSVVNALLLGSTPYPHPDRLVLVSELLKTSHGMMPRSPAIANVLDWAAGSSVFEDIGVAEQFVDTGTLIAGGPAEPVRPQAISANLLRVLGVEPMIGRYFLEGEPAILLSYPYWKRRFGGDPGVLGRSVLAGGRSAVVVGVMPPRFVILGGNNVEIWVNANMRAPAYLARKEHWFSAIGRLKPGVSMERAQAELETVSVRLAAAYPETNREVGAIVQDLREYVAGDFRKGAYLLLGAVGFVLLIACANVANLLLSRLAARGREMSLRASLGASRARLVRQMMTESAVLALAGGGLGYLLTGWLLSALTLAVPGLVAGLYASSADWRVLAFTAAITILTALLFGLAPAWRIGRLDLNTSLQEAARTTAGVSAHRVRGALVVCEVALAIVLLAGTGLMIRTLLRVGAVDPGFDRHNVLTVMTHLAGPKYVSTVDSGRDMKKIAAATGLFYARLMERASALPGVEAAAYTSDLPDTGLQVRTFTISGLPAPPEDQRPRTGYYEVSPSFFQTLRIPVRMGRVFGESDRGGAPWTVVVDETFARRYFPGENPVGRYIRFRFEPYKVEEDQPRLIVGVVGDVKWWPRNPSTLPTAYASEFQQPGLFPGGRTSAHLRRRLLLRTHADVRAASAPLLTALKSIVADLDREIPVAQVKTMDSLLAESETDTRYLTRLLGIFGSLAVILAAVGIYGMMTCLVTERTREIGIRMALGAERADVVRFVVRRALLLTAAGVFCGVAAAIVLTRLIAQALFGVTPLDPVTHASAVLLLAAVALAASWLPARRAARLDPIAALRHE